ncbi:response regulator [Trinickia sp. YCB016]
MNQLDFKKLNFLVVDDVPMMRQVAATQLRALDIANIEFAANGREALQVIARQPIDMVLSDWNMPVMDGLTLLRRIRGDSRLAHIPLILITAEVERDQVEAAIKSGVSDLLVKPYTAQRMEDKIVGALQRIAPETAGLTESETPAVEHKPTILVVDDTHENLRLVSDLFEDRYRVRVADSGQKALAICTADVPPDLVLLDVMMPGMDGFEVARKMREHPNSEHIPVIFVTALSDSESQRRGYDLGAVDFVSKPIDSELLQIRVGNFIRYVELYKQRQQEYDTMLANARLRENVERMLRHDLRNPIAGVVSLIREFSETAPMAGVHSERVRQIEKAAQQALGALNLSAELFKIETGRFQLSPVPVAVGEIIAHSAGLARATFAVKTLQIEVEGDAEASKMTAQGDPVLCQSIFQNLINNACEASPDSGLVRISLHDETPLRVVIENRGAVPSALRTHFFERYATAGKSGGSGVGTYSAKLLTEAQGGRIAMDTSDTDDHTRLTVTLPRS